MNIIINCYKIQTYLLDLKDRVCGYFAGNRYDHAINTWTQKNNGESIKNLINTHLKNQKIQLDSPKYQRALKRIAQRATWLKGGSTSWHNQNLIRVNVAAKGLLAFSQRRLSSYPSPTKESYLR